MVDIVLRQRDRWIVESHADSVWEGVLESEPEPHDCLAQNRLDDALSAFAEFTGLTCPSRGLRTTLVVWRIYLPWT